MCELNPGRLLRTVVAIATVILMTFGYANSASASNSVPPVVYRSSLFSDVGFDAKFHTEIIWLARQKITTGYSDGSFHPKESVSREAFAAFLYRLAGKPAVALPSRSPFKDVNKSDQFYKEIVWLASQGITTGYSDGTFRPEGNITREAIAAFLYREAGKPSFSPPTKSPFRDMTPRSSFYKEVTWLAKSGVTTGYSDGTFRPKSSVTREATAAFLYRGHASLESSKPVVDSGDRWVPAVGDSWQWQLSGSLDTGVSAQVFDVDAYDTSAAQVQYLHSKGRYVICYISAGSYESYSPDSGSFPSAVRGQTLDGWQDERWLDIRQLNVLLPIMAARMDMCAKKGFDAVEPDNVDGYQNQTGFALTAKDQDTYNRAIAKLARDRGLAVGLKNDLDQVAQLEPFFDFAVNEQCAEYGECTMLTPFIQAGKPVFHVEYDLPLSSFCSTTTKLGFSSMRKNLDLDAAREPCPK
ncbi:endo alpha-1,4 polygalactosaminidase [Demequina aurantiaca]|uniref:endo alpha-1,4 polygalactosaminidase n=1 Tax=Demequina aurantiaca TaxID=676200 RepID=UPI003D34CF0E